jgi:hypothetical protein
MANGIPDRKCKYCISWNNREGKEGVGQCTSRELLSELPLTLRTTNGIAKFPILLTHENSLCPHFDWRLE